MLLSVQEVCWVCRVTNKTIYKYIALGHLKASPRPTIRTDKAARYDISIEAVRACPFLIIDETRFAGIQPDMSAPMPVVPRQPVLTHSYPFSPTPRSGGMIHHDLPRIESEALADHALLPMGSVRFTTFIKRHGVNEWTARDELTNKLIAVTTIPTSRKDGQREKWVTPTQQSQMIRVWQTLQTPGFSECASCPHLSPEVG